MCGLSEYNKQQKYSNVEWEWATTTWRDGPGAWVLYLHGNGPSFIPVVINADVTLCKYSLLKRSSVINFKLKIKIRSLFSGK